MDFLLRQVSQEEDILLVVHSRRYRGEMLANGIGLSELEVEGKLEAPEP